MGQEKKTSWLNNKHLSIQLETTSRCNLHCITCLRPAYQDDWKERDMKWPLFQKIVDQLPKQATIHLQGWGEPLLHPDTIRHITYLKEKGFTVSFTTNGSLMTREIGEQLLQAGLDGITFSMAGGKEKTHDILRGKNSFKKLDQGMRALLEARESFPSATMKTAVSYLLTPQTVTELPTAIRWCRNRKVNSFVAVHLSQAGCRIQQQLQLILTLKEASRYRLLRIRSNLAWLFSNMRVDIRSFAPELSPVCDKNPTKSLFISANGSVSPCVFLCPPLERNIQLFLSPDTSIVQKKCVFGNLQKETLQQISKRETYKLFRRKFLERSEYHDSQLAKVEYSMAGPILLERSLKKIQHFFKEHPAPDQCTHCNKLEGF